jgi:hypothetical protein
MRPSPHPATVSGKDRRQTNGRDMTTSDVHGPVDFLLLEFPDDRLTGRVLRRRAERYVDRDAQIAADREQAYESQRAPAFEQAPTAPPAEAGPDPLAQLSRLGELNARGILTEEEFAREKAKVLGY